MTEFTYVSHGEGLYCREVGSGPRVVLLHGGGGDHRAVAPLALALSQWFRVLTPDLRGSGRSRFGGEITFDLMADDIAALLTHVGAAAVPVAGVSYGAAVAARFAIRHRYRCQALIAVTPAHAGVEQGYTPFQQGALGAMAEAFQRVPIEGLAAVEPLYAALPDPIREGALAMIRAWDPASMAATGALIGSGAQPFDLTELASITAPTLVIKGEDDMHPPAISQLWAETIVEARLVEPPPNGDPGRDAFIATEIMKHLFL